jgi:hypothetical protein
MSLQYPSGLITKTPVTPSGPYETSTASGVWTLDEQAYWQKLGQWPTQGNIPKDAQFNYVTMLLHGDGTNGAQNNTFLDSSTNNFTITRNGNTTQGSFSPYGSGWSNYFDGTGDYLTAANNTALDVGTGAFTIEGWIYRDGTGDADWRLVAGSVSSAGFFGGRGTLSLGFGRSAVAWDLESASNVYSLNTWTHVVYVRNGSGNLAIFANGTRVATTTNSNNYGLNGGLLEVGAEGAGQYIGGYISNVRVVKGSAVYDPTSSTLTVPTTPLTAVSGTGLLTCQSNRFIDNSTNNFTLTVNGNTSVQRFNPFGTPTAYSTSVIGGSAYFDGSGDYLQVANDSAFDFSGDFTVECWLYLANTNNQTFISKGGHNALGPDAAGWALFIYTGQGLRFMTRNSGGTNVPVTVASTPQINTWMHVAISRSGSSMKAFLNGTLVSTVTSSVNTANSSPFNIGANLNNLSPSTGYICDVRIIKGTAQYTATFTPPTAPLTAITDTQFLENFTNGAIFDNAMINDLETVGDAQIKTNVKKYGTGSMYFEGSGDYLSTRNSPASTPSGVGSWTIEGWIYPSTVDGSLRTIYTNGYPIQIFFKSGSIEIYISSAAGSGSYIINGIGGPASSISANAWSHFAVVKNGNIYTVYVNGVGGTSGTSATAVAFPSATNATIGDAPVFGSYPYFGYIDDFRITNGYARYTANFTPPTAAFFNYGPT